VPFTPRGKEPGPGNQRLGTRVFSSNYQQHTLRFLRGTPETHPPSESRTPDLPRLTMSRPPDAAKASAVTTPTQMRPSAASA
jgi:hypothetical protein